MQNTRKTIFYLEPIKNCHVIYYRYLVREARSCDCAVHRLSRFHMDPDQNQCPPANPTCHNSIGLSLTVTDLTG